MIEKYLLAGSNKSVVGSGKSAVGSNQSVVGSRESAIGSQQSAVNIGQQANEQNQIYKLQMITKWTSRFGGITNYKLRLWWLWYPYRWWVGAKGLFKLIVGSKQ